VKATANFDDSLHQSDVPCPETPTSDHPRCGLSRDAAWGPEKGILSDYFHPTGAITNVLQKRGILPLWNPLP
jgi:hypothetical protein